MMATFGQDASLGASVNMIIKNLEKFRKGFGKAAAQLVTATTREIQTQAKARFAPEGSGDRGSAHGLSPHRITGALSRAIKRTPTTRNGDIVEGYVYVSNDVEEYARSVEFGGITRPKHAKALAIPLNKKARRMALKAGGNLRSLNLIQIHQTDGDVFLALPPRAGARKNRDIEILFVLKRSARHRPHPFLKPAGEVSRKAFVDGARKIAEALAR